MIKGVKIELSGKEYVVPPLNLRGLKLHQDEFAELDASGSNRVNQMDIVVGMAATAMQRNYPDITKDHLLDIVAINQIDDLMSAVLGASALQSSKGESEGEA